MVYDYETYVNWLETTYNFKFVDIQNRDQFNAIRKKILAGIPGRGPHSRQGLTAINKFLGQDNNPPPDRYDTEIAATWQRLINEEQAREQQQQAEETQAQQDQATQTLQEIQNQATIQLQNNPTIFNDPIFQKELNKRTRSGDILTPDETNQLLNIQQQLQDQRQNIINTFTTTQENQIADQLTLTELEALQKQKIIGAGGLTKTTVSEIEAALPGERKANKERARQIQEILKQNNPTYKKR